jgi:plastocyanin
MRTSNPVIVMGAVAFTALTLVAGCSSAAKTTSSTTSQAQEVTIVMSGFKFSPDRLDLKAGQTVRFVVINQDVTKHEILFGDQETQDEHEKMMAGGSLAVFTISIVWRVGFPHSSQLLSRPASTRSALAKLRHGCATSSLPSEPRRGPRPTPRPRAEAPRRLNRLSRVYSAVYTMLICENNGLNPIAKVELCQNPLHVGSNR